MRLVCVHPSNPRHLILARRIFRVALRRGRRQHIFLPKFVITLVRGRHDRALLTTECEGSRHASRNPFWRGLPAPLLRLSDRGMIRARYRPTELGDFDPVRSIVEDRLEAARACPPVPMLESVSRRKLFRLMAPPERDRLATALARVDVPLSSMHGDLHLFNFVADGERYRLIDWEHFDGRGSFVHDYVDFFASARMIAAGGAWHDLLGRMRADDPIFRSVETRLNIDPKLLLVYYLYLKIDTILRHQGGDPDRASPLLDVLRRAIAALPRMASAPV